MEHLKNEVWVEKYRPQTIEQCILPKKLKDKFNKIVDKGTIPNMFLHGTSGTGKTTVARALANELGYEYKIINASSERGLDLIRETIAGFASKASMSGRKKLFILDEADHLLPDTQAALRAATDKFSATCSFILTGNYPNRIIEPMQSRCPPVDFNIPQDEFEELQARMFVRIEEILNQEKVEYDEHVLVKMVQKFFPDNRRLLGELDIYAKSGKIDEGILMQLDEVKFEELIKAMKSKKFKEVVQWAEDNKNTDTSLLYENLYKNLKGWVTKESIPDAIMILEDAQRYDSVVASKELHLAATAVEMMMQLEFE